MISMKKDAQNALLRKIRRKELQQKPPAVRLKMSLEMTRNKNETPEPLKREIDEFLTKHRPPGALLKEHLDFLLITANSDVAKEIRKALGQEESSSSSSSAGSTKSEEYDGDDDDNGKPAGI